MNLPTSSVTSLKRFSMSSVESFVSLLIFSNESLIWSNSFSNPLRSCLSTLSNKSRISSTFLLTSLPESTISLNWSSSLLNLVLPKSPNESCISPICLSAFLSASSKLSNCFSSFSPNLLEPRPSITSERSSIRFCAFCMASLKSLVDAVILIFTVFSLTLCFTTL